MGGLLGTIAGAIPGIGSIAGPLVAGVSSLIGQNSANAANAAMVDRTNAFNANQAALARTFNAGEAEKNRQFQDHESSTAWQRGVADIKAAGLNPALAYGQGGASAPSGSTASSPSASGVTARMDNSVGAGVASALSAADFVQRAQTNEATRQQIAAQTDLTRAQADNTRTLMAANLAEIQSRAGLNSARTTREGVESNNVMQMFPYRVQLLREEARQAGNSADSIFKRATLYGPERELLEASLPAARNASSAANTWWGRNVIPYLNSGTSVLRSLTPFVR